MSRSDELDDFLNRCAKEVAQKLPALSVGESVFALSFLSRRFKGYLALVTGKAVLGGAPPDLFFQNLLKKFREKGEPGQDSTATFCLEARAKPFMEWTRQKALKGISLQMGTQEIYFFYIPKKTLPTFEGPRNLPPYLEFKFSECLVEGVRLRFDLYLYLPENQKYLRYLKAGSILSDRLWNKLKTFEVQSMYIKAEDRSAFLAYTLECLIAGFENGIRIPAA